MIYLITGRTLLFNSTLILVLVLRYTITKLRELGLAVVLPVDNNIYLHKVTGWLIFIQSLFHTVMHLCNFGKRKVILESKSIFNRLLIGLTTKIIFNYILNIFPSYKHSTWSSKICSTNNRILGRLWR